MEREILKEFLIKLGYVNDQVGMRKFTNQLGTVTAFATEAGKAIAGVAVAAEGMVTVFASSMEKLYYASRRTKQSVETLQGLDFAAGQVGISAETVKQSIENMAAALRTNPGLKGLLAKLGINPESKNLLTDFVKQMEKFPDYVRGQYGSMFGIDPQTLNQLIQFLPEFEAAQKKRAQMNRDAGVDAEKMAKVMRDYMNLLREVWERVTILGQKLAVELLPYFEKFANLVNEALTALMRFKATDLSKIDLGPFASDLKSIVADLAQLVGMLTMLANSDPSKGFFLALKETLLDIAKMVSSLSAAMAAFVSGNWSKVPGHLKNAFEALVRGTPFGEPWKSGAENDVDSIYSRGNKPILPQGAAGAQGQMQPHQRYLAQLERMYGLPAGLLDRVWKQESSRGVNMLSPKGAKGHFGFMPKTAEEYGVKDPNDFADSARGAAAYLGNLLRMNDGDLSKALAGYNWGPGNVAKYGLGAAPAETRKYIQDVGGGLIVNQENNITVHGANDPNGTAKAVGAEQGRVNGDLIRNLKPNLQ